MSAVPGTRQDRIVVVDDDARIRDLVRRYLRTHSTFDLLPEKVSIHLNDTHPVVAIPELLRVARDAQSLVYNPSPIVLAALMYLALLWPLTRVLARLERGRLQRAGH